MKPADIFNKGLSLPHLATTAYPPDKSVWKDYLSNHIYSVWEGAKDFALYIHIPFCKSRCDYCEYTTTQIVSNEFTEKYLSAVIYELNLYENKIDFTDNTLYGFDIGGGTPTLLSVKQMDYLLSNVKPFVDNFKQEKFFEQGIETNTIITNNSSEILKLLTEYGFTRISLGIQSASSKILKSLNREIEAESNYFKALEVCRKAGFKKINLDIMYGLPGQTLSSWINTLKLILKLNPEQISIYETRYKDSKLKRSSHNAESLFKMYNKAYNFLNSEGYRGIYGTTAMTKNSGDLGLSSYLHYRTTDFINYIGLGASSQSMTMQHLSYNYAKASGKIEEYIEQSFKNSPVEYFYLLPKEEIIAKHVSISFYLGFLNYRLLDKKLNIKFIKIFKEELEFLQNNSLIIIDDEKIKMTGKGVKNIHGIIPLFYSKNAKEYLFNYLSTF